MCSSLCTQSISPYSTSSVITFSIPLHGKVSRRNFRQICDPIYQRAYLVPITCPWLHQSHKTHKSQERNGQPIANTRLHLSYCTHLFHSPTRSFTKCGHDGRGFPTFPPSVESSLPHPSPPKPKPTATKSRVRTVRCVASAFRT